MICQTLDGRLDKDKIGKFCSDIAEANHELKSVINSNFGEECQNIIILPWLLIEQQNNDINMSFRK